MADYQIITDATADLNDGLLTDLPHVPHVEVIPMKVEIGGSEYTYGPLGNITVSTFYELQRAGNFASTSQISPAIYYRYFKPYLRHGMDILYLCFSSGMSGTFQSAQIAAQELMEEYPERNIICIDTLCASVGEGFLVREAVRRKAEDWTLAEMTDWVMDHRLQVCHWFTVDTFVHLRHGGRVSPQAAAMGAVLQIKPLLHVDENGCLQVCEKPRGTRRAIAAQIARMKAGWMPELGNLVMIGHGDNPEGAGRLAREVQAYFPEADIHVADIGPVIGAHTGPGMLTVIYWGNNR